MEEEKLRRNEKKRRLEREEAERKLMAAEDKDIRDE